MKTKLRWAVVPVTAAAMLIPFGTPATGDSEPVAPQYAPPPLVDGKVSPIFKNTGVDPAKQQRGARSPLGKQFYRSTNGKMICITDETGSGHCNTPRQVENGRVFGGELCNRKDLPEHLTRISGAVPAAAVKAVLRTGAGTTYESAAVIGTVAFEVPRNEAGTTDHVDITWTLDDGQQKTIELPMPPFIKGTDCA